MAQNRKNVAYIKLPYGTDCQKAKVTKIGKMAVICTQRYEKNNEVAEESAKELPKSVSNCKGENF